MDIFFKAAAAILLTVIVGHVLATQGKDFSVLLIISVSCMVLATSVSFFQKIFTFLYALEEAGGLNSEVLSILLKTIGIGLLSEVVTMICNDSGNQALGKALQILSSAVILWLCIPMFNKLMDLLEGILRAV